MTASLPPAVQAVFAEFATTELTTVGRAGQPVTWPVTPYYRPGAPCIDVTTSLGYPKKADEARANPLVALLFSDPARSGLPRPPMVLVQGSAQVDDRDPGANRARYARESREKPAGSAGRVSGRLGRYLDRIYVHVRPERVYVWPEGNIAAEPELYDAHMEEVRSGHSEEPERFHARPGGGASAWSPRIAELGTRYETAVLSLVSPDGFPFAVRVPVHVDAAARWVAIDGAPAGIPFQPGLACLTAHAEGPGASRPRGLQVRGDLIFVEDTWALVPHQVSAGLETPRLRLTPWLPRRRSRAGPR